MTIFGARDSVLDRAHTWTRPRVLGAGYARAGLRHCPTHDNWSAYVVPRAGSFDLQEEGVHAVSAYENMGSK